MRMQQILSKKMETCLHGQGDIHLIQRWRKQARICSQEQWERTFPTEVVNAKRDRAGLCNRPSPIVARWESHGGKTGEK